MLNGLFGALVFMGMSAPVFALPSQNFADYDLSPAQAAQGRAQDRVNDLEGQKSDWERRIELAESQLSSAEFQLQRNSQDIDSLHRESQDLASEIPRLQHEVDQARRHKEGIDRRVDRQERELRRDKGSQKREVETAQRQVKDKQGQVGAVKAELDKEKAKNPVDAGKVDQLQKQLAAAQAEVQAAQKNLQDVRQRAQQNEGKFKQAEQQIREGKDRSRELANRIEHGQRKLERDNRRYNQIPGEIARLESANDSLRSQIRDLNSDLRNYNANLDQVRMNLSAAYDVLNDTTAEVERIQRNLDAANSEVSAVAKVDATADGKKEGADSGYKDGDVDAAERAGNENGTAAAQDNSTYDGAAYKSGYARGESTAWKKIKEDAASEKRRGYKDKEQDYRNSPLRERTLTPEKALASQNMGAQSSLSDDADSKYYNPRPAAYPHPQITQYYKEAYSRNFRVESGKQWQISHDLSDSENYPKYKGGTKTSSEYTKSYNDANRVASDSRGDSEGYKNTIDANLGIEKKKGYYAGVQEADALYLNHPVLDNYSIQLIDDDGDGFILPGESARLVVKVKNYGHKDQENVTASIQGSGSVGGGSQNYKVPDLPAQSDITVVGLGQYSVPSHLEAGQTFNLNTDIKLNGVSAYKQSLVGRIDYPFNLEVAYAPVDFSASDMNDIQVKITNKSTVNQAATLHLQQNSKLEDSKPVNFIVGPQQSVVVTVQGKGKSNSARQWVTLQVSITKQGMKASGVAEKKVQVVEKPGCWIPGQCD